MKLGFSILPLFFSSCLFAQTGTRYKSLANQTTALTDIWSINSNPAGSPRSATIVFATLKEYNFISTDIKNEALAISFPLKKLRVSFSAFRYGNAHFKQANFASSFALNFKSFSLGLGTQVQQIRVPLIETEQIINLSVGTQIPINSQWVIGLGLSSFDLSNKAPLLESTLNFGLGYAPTKQILVSTSLCKLRNSSNLSGGVGLEYKIIDPFALRLGFQSNPSLRSLGFEYTYKNWKFLSAVSNHPSLGNKIQIELNYEL